MLSTLLLMTLVLLVSVGNLALGYGLALHLGQGPAAGWRALMFWKRAGGAAHAAGHATDAHASPAPVAHGHAHAH